MASIYDPHRRVLKLKPPLKPVLDVPGINLRPASKGTETAVGALDDGLRDGASIYDPHRRVLKHTGRGKVDGFVKTGKWPWLRYRLLLFIWLILQRSQPSQ